MIYIVCVILFTYIYGQTCSETFQLFFFENLSEQVWLQIIFYIYFIDVYMQTCSERFHFFFVEIFLSRFYHFIQYICIYSTYSVEEEVEEGKEEEEDIDHVMSISLWKTSHIIREYSPKDVVGNLKIPTAWLDTVVDSFGARQLYDKHVNIMYESTKRGILDLKAVVMIFRDELQGAGLDPANIQLDGLETKPDGVHFYVIVGAHTVGAIQQHHSERPNNKLYKTVACQVIVCDNTLENRDHARDYGTLENNLRALGKNSNGWDILWQLRQVKLQSDELDMNTADKNAWYQEQKKRIARDHNIDFATTMGNYNSIACLKTSLFKKVKQIFEGKVHGAKFMPPTAITPFRDMSTWCIRR